MSDDGMIANPKLLALASVDAYELLHRAYLNVGALDEERRRAWSAIERAQSFVLWTGVSSGPERPCEAK